MGMSGSMVQHMPLSIMYAAVDSIKAGFEIDLLDVRLCPHSWKQAMTKAITSQTLLVGISVMTGTPIHNALEISRFVKEQHPDLPLVWGGPHTTFNALETLTEPSVDYVIKGYGSKPLSLLAKCIAATEGAPRLDEVPGLAYRRDGTSYQVPEEGDFEMIHYQDIPYHLIEKDLSEYGQLDSSERIFSIYSVMGCPYQCAFCSSPAQYRRMKKKYLPFNTQEVVDHIEYVHKRYQASYIYFIDDDSFVSLDRVEKIIDEISSRGLSVRLGFRGARINELKKMDDEYLSKLAKAGTDILHIGAESGSQKILDLIRKNCTVEDIIEVNQKLSRHPEIKSAYNWIVGLPGETVEDLRRSQKLMLRLLRDNPSTLIFIPNKFRPLPGTELYEIALEQGYEPPKKLEEWANVEAEGDYSPPWYTPEQEQQINMMRITSYFIDNKISKVDTGKTLKYRLIAVLATLYAPFARIRLSAGFARFLIEYRVFKTAAKLFRL
jgi:radical SAM superfamily enzyme YgiQ (UPF0313 family)